MRCVFGLVAVFGLVLSGCTPTEVAQSDGNNVTTDGGEAAEVSSDSSEMPAGTETTDPSDSSSDPVPATTDAAPATSDDAPATSEAPAAAESPAPAEAAALTPVPVEGGVATLSPDNTKIQFTGTHSPPKKPDPRVGGFAKFTGEAKVDADAKTLQSVSVEIDTTSLFTAFPKLTDHLNSPDFFETREYPTAKFESTEIAAGGEGQIAITGNLTLHGQTKEISFPATMSITDEGLTLKGDFSINRSEFGMNFGEGQVDDKVLMAVAIGEKTQTP